MVSFQPVLLQNILQIGKANAEELDTPTRRYAEIKDRTHFVAAAPAYPKCVNGLRPGKSEAHPTQPIVGHSIPSTE
jgi:hypothetical protein